MVETHVGAAWVVSVENLPHEREEIDQPSLPQCLTDRRAAIAFAKFAGLHVRMRSVRTAGRRIRIDGKDFIRSQAIQAAPVECNKEGAKLDVIEHNVIGLNRHG